MMMQINTMDHADLRELCLLGGIHPEDARALERELNPAAYCQQAAEEPAVLSIHTASGKGALCHD